MTEIGTEWRALDGVATAWFDARSLVEGAALARRITALSEEIAIDLRATGVRVRLDADEHAGAVSAVARELGLSANPSALQQLSVVFESPSPALLQQFWKGVVNYEPGEDGDLRDPLRRDPTLHLRQAAEPRPLRSRIHLDVVRPASAVAEAATGEASGPYGVRHADPDGNEVDLVPGGALGDQDETVDWHAVFGAVACYRTSSSLQQQDLAAAAAALADAAGFPLLIDLRPGLVIIDSAKDRWEGDDLGTGPDFVLLAGNIQAAARDLGATADPALPRFVQLFLDAADVVAVRAFWVAALGYVPDPRAGVTDINDPRRLSPELVFQELDPSETERRRQRNRIAVELAVPSDVARERVGIALAAGGRLLDESDGQWRIADPEGNELLIVSGT